ncbi:MAG TPA: hypothetical protein VKE88_03140, partial [Candidatus Nanoarchaeia archaeon]|nr:hypothetical protein [Candidatus Nanoarchaeia archaeon]
MVENQKNIADMKILAKRVTELKEKYYISSQQAKTHLEGIKTFETKPIVISDLINKRLQPSAEYRSTPNRLIGISYALTNFIDSLTYEIDEKGNFVEVPMEDGSYRLTHHPVEIPEGPDTIQYTSQSLTFFNQSCQPQYLFFSPRKTIFLGADDDLSDEEPRLIAVHPNCPDENKIADAFSYLFGYFDLAKVKSDKEACDYLEKRVLNEFKTSISDNISQGNLDEILKKIVSQNSIFRTNEFNEDYVKNATKYLKTMLAISHAPILSHLLKDGALNTNKKSIAELYLTESGVGVDSEIQ